MTRASSSDQLPASIVDVIFLLIVLILIAIMLDDFIRGKRLASIQLKD